MILIGISGKKNTGKNTVADMIQHFYNDDFNTRQMGFADALKDEVCKEFGVSREFLEENKDMFRSILQAWGELKRKIMGEDYWVDRLLSRLTKLPPSVKMVIVTDVRYRNEANRLRRFDGSILIRTERIVSFLKLDKHSSETDLDDSVQWDEIIENNKTKDDLFRVVREILVKRKVI